MSNSWFTIDANGFMTMLIAAFVGFAIKYLWDLAIRAKEQKDQKAESFDKAELENMIRSIVKEQIDILRAERKAYDARLDTVELKVKNIEIQDIDYYRTELEGKCKMYIARGYMTTSELDRLTELHRIYNALGGNSDGDMYYHKAINVKIVNEKKPDVEDDNEKRGDDN